MMVPELVSEAYFAHLVANNPNFAQLTPAEVNKLKADLNTLVGYILDEVKKATITVNVSSISITNPLGLVTPAGPVTGVAPAAGTGTGTATITA